MDAFGYGEISLDSAVSDTGLSCGSFGVSSFSSLGLSIGLFVCEQLNYDSRVSTDLKAAVTRITMAC